MRVSVTAVFGAMLLLGHCASTQDQVHDQPVGNAPVYAALAKWSASMPSPDGDYVVVLDRTLNVCDPPALVVNGCLQDSVIIAMSRERGLEEANRESHPITFARPEAARLISRPQLRRTMSGRDGWRSFYERYRRSRGYVEFSTPAYAQDGTQAVAYVGIHRGYICGTGWLVRLRRLDTSWTVEEKRLLWES